jgi:hypothetical protein
LLQRRETYGFTVIQLDAGFALRRVEEIAPVIERLAG